MKPYTYFIVTLGCQMNERDSETIAGILDTLGMYPAREPWEARVLVINTCSVRAKPEEKAYSRLGQWHALKQDDPRRIIVVAGCMSQVAADDIARRAPYADIVIGPRNLGHLQQAISQRIADNTGDPIILVGNTDLLPEGLPAHRSDGISAFVNINYGCDNYCAYCIVPYARGPEVSRIPAEVIAECRDALETGYVEITLLGQNVNSYGHDLHPTMEFADLLLEVGALPGLRRLRFTTSHPKDISWRLLQTMTAIPALCEHLHLPIQSGDNEILTRMGRGYTCEHFTQIVSAARTVMPAIAVTTDVMVGFPGETPAQFDNTMRAFESIRFDQAFMFKYNDRPGTKAAEIPDKVPEEEKQHRLAELIELQNNIGRDINRATQGQVFEVLVEGPDRKTPGALRGRTRQNKIMIFPATTDLTGRIVNVRAGEGFLWGHRGELA